MTVDGCATPLGVALETELLERTATVVPLATTGTCQVDVAAWRIDADLEVGHTALSFAGGPSTNHESRSEHQ
jgi:hypothetical protein